MIHQMHIPETEDQSFVVKYFPCFSLITR